MRYASVFLSHSHHDRDLVHAVAEELGRLGVVPWLDVNELVAGQPLRQAISVALHRQIAVVPFISSAALESEWVQMELEQAIDAEHDSTHRDRIFPVFLEEAVPLILRHQSLLGSWLDPNHRAIDRVYVPANEPDVSAIARHLATALYRQLRTQSARDLVIFIDQRGVGGRRVGEPPPNQLPPALVNQDDWPTLVFRPDMAERTRAEVLSGEGWKAFMLGVQHAISEAIGPRQVRGRRIRVCGSAQLAIAFVLGRYFDRSSRVHLFAYGREGAPFELNMENELAPLEDGDPNCNAVDEENRVLPLPPGEHVRISLVLATKAHLQSTVEHIHALSDAPPIVWLPTKTRYEESAEIIELIRNLTALLRRLRRDHKTRQLDLYTTLPFHALPLVAAMLTHVVHDGDIRFMELNRGGDPGSSLYSPLSVQVGI